MIAPRYSGKLSAWVEADGFGEITPNGPLGPQVVRREALRQGGIKTPAIGMAVTFEVGDIGGGVTGAVNLEVPRTATAESPTVEEPMPISTRPAMLRRRDV